MSRYEKYKDSGIAWIGEIPAGWDTISLKGIFRENNERSEAGTETLLSLSQYTGVKPKSESSVSDSHIAESYEGYKLVREGQLVMNIMLAWNGSYALSNYDGMISPAYCVYDFKIDCSKKYYHYLLKIQGYPDAFKTVSRGIIESRLRLYPEQFYKFSTLLPSLAEQEAIAEFLDGKCEEVDRLVGLQQSMIEELVAYKQSVITECVTKGLDPSAPLRDSGIPWIGSIPQHWEVCKLLYALSMPITDGPHETPIFIDNGIPFISAESVKNGKINFDLKRGYITEEYYKLCCLKYTPKINDIYMIKSGATTGNIALVETNDIFQIWSPLAAFRVNKNYDPKYFYYYLQSDALLKQVQLNWSYGTQQNIGMRVLEKLIVTFLPLQEQQAIADHLDRKCEEIDNLISIKREKIEQLKEYKKSIIFEYVTGKKRVMQ